VQFQAELEQSVLAKDRALRATLAVTNH